MEVRGAARVSLIVFLLECSRATQARDALLQCSEMYNNGAVPMGDRIRRSSHSKTRMFEPLFSAEALSSSTRQDQQQQPELPDCSLPVGPRHTNMHIPARPPCHKLSTCNAPSEIALIVLCSLWDKSRTSILCFPSSPIHSFLPMSCLDPACPG